jgi:hypothetical protein
METRSLAMSGPLLRWLALGVLIGVPWLLHTLRDHGKSIRGGPAHGWLAAERARWEVEDEVDAENDG